MGRGSRLSVPSLPAEGEGMLSLAKLEELINAAGMQGMECQTGRGVVWICQRYVVLGKAAANDG